MDNLSVNKISSSPIIPPNIITQKNSSDNTSSEVCFQDDFAFASPVSSGSADTSFSIPLEECEQPLPEEEICNSDLGKDWQVLAPLGKDKDLFVYFLAALPDQERMIDFARWFQSDDLQRIREKGYTVIIDNKASIGEFASIIYDPKTAGVVHLAHGSKGMTSFVADDDYHKVIGLPPKAIKKDEVSPNLKFVMYYSCEAAQSEKEWENVLGTDLIGWDRIMKEQEVYFSSAGFGTKSLSSVIEQKL